MGGRVAALVRQRRVRLAAAALLLSLVGWHYWSLYADLRGGRADLLAAQTRLNDVGLDLTANDLAIARQRVNSADTEISHAKLHYRWDPAIQLSRLVPGVRDQVNAVGSFLDMAGTLVEIADTATRTGDRVIAVRDRPREGQPLTAALVQLLNDSHADIERINALTARLVDQRLALGDRPLIGPLASAREKIDQELPRVANAVEEAAQAQDLLPGFFGFKGDRRYMVFALNTGEMFPGGGFLTAAGVLPVSQGVNGKVDFTDSTEWKGQWEAKGGGFIEPPGPVGRYLLRGWGWNLSTSNWDPDFPTWSQQSLDFYQLVHGEQHVDGIVAVDLAVLEQLLSITGPKTIPVEGRGDVTFDSANAVLTMEELTRQPFDTVHDRKSVIGDLAERVISDLLKLPSGQWGQAVKVMRKLGEQHHIQVLSFDAREQTIVRDAGWSGRLQPTTGDYLMFNEASLNSTKLNLIIQPEGSYHIDLSHLGDARHELKLTYRNPLPEWSKGKDPVLVQKLMVGGLYGGYLRILAPPGLVIGDNTINEEHVLFEDSGQHEGKVWFGVFMAVLSGEQEAVALRWSIPLATRDPNSYDLFIQKQAGTRGMCVDFEVTREGQPARRLTVSGGSRDGTGRLCLTTDVRVHAEF